MLQQHLRQLYDSTELRAIWKKHVGPQPTTSSSLAATIHSKCVMQSPQPIANRRSGSPPTSATSVKRL
ncbi:unnamed protein product [Ceratitis capitata]|uniref:(Mediterranean fruit fly) hypothetical protein n=1 Tax=Ceratitis capitata TaxID=7213 RepID=A0A811U3P9_CERCA|nr:unnamed protein product [Ceratitis capitata]